MLFQKLRKNTRGILIVVAIAFGASLFYTGAMALMDRRRGKQEVAANSIALVNGEPISWAAFQENVYANLRYQEMMGGRVSPLMGDKNDGFLNLDPGYWDNNREMIFPSDYCERVLLFPVLFLQ